MLDTFRFRIFCVPFVFQSVKTKIYRNTGLNIALYVCRITSLNYWNYKSTLHIHNNSHLVMLGTLRASPWMNLNLNWILKFGRIFFKYLAQILHLVTLCIFIKLFCICFTKSKSNHTLRNNVWITGGIKVSCRNKSISYLSGRERNGNNLKLRYKEILKIETCYKATKNVMPG